MPAIAASGRPSAYSDRRCGSAVTEATLTHRPLFDPSRPPPRAAVDSCLGAAAPLWNSIIGRAVTRAPRLAEAWHFAGPKIGWSLRLVDDDRIVVYLTPGEGMFRVGLVLGGKAVAAAREAGLSAEATAILDAAPRHAEGYGVRFPVASSKDMAPFEELLSIKLAVPPKPQRRSRRA